MALRRPGARAPGGKQRGQGLLRVPPSSAPGPRELRSGWRCRAEQSRRRPEAVAHTGVPGLGGAMRCARGSQIRGLFGARGCRGAGKAAGEGCRRAWTRGSWRIRAAGPAKINRREGEGHGGEGNAPPHGQSSGTGSAAWRGRAAEPAGRPTNRTGFSGTKRVPGGEGALEEVRCPRRRSGSLLIPPSLLFFSPFSFFLFVSPILSPGK